MVSKKKYFSLQSNVLFLTFFIVMQFLCLLIKNYKTTSIFSIMPSVGLDYRQVSDYNTAKYRIELSPSIGKF